MWLGFPLLVGLVDVGFVVVFVAAVGGATDDPLLPAAFVGYGLDLGFCGLDLGFRGLGFDVLLRLLLLPTTEEGEIVYPWS